MKMKKLLLRVTAAASLLLLFSGLFASRALASQTVQDYYNTLLKYRRTPVYYNNQPRNPAPPNTNPSTPPDTSPSLPPIQETPGKQPAPQLPATPAGLTDSEARLFEMLNSARIDNGVRPVEIDMKLVEAARAKARDLVEKNYFSHTSPTYGSVSQLLKTFGIRYQRYGENLAKAGDVNKAHLLLLYSTSGHREIMLNPDFTKVGVAVVPKGNWVMVVELFIKP